MKKLSETWKQRKPFAGAVKSRDVGETAANSVTSSKRLGRVAIQPSSSKHRSTVTSSSPETKVKVVSCTAGSSGIPGCSFSSSFAVDFDTDLIKAADSLEAAAGLAPGSNDDADRDGSHGPRPTHATTPSRQKQTLAGQTACANPGKRKSARRLNVRKQSLFGDDGVGVGALVAEAVTPTQSPRNKKRRDSSDQTLLRFRNSARLLCPASPSPELRWDQHGSGGGLSPRPFLSSSKESLLRKAAERQDVGSKTEPLKEDDDVEIETNISPVLNLSENASKSACCKTNVKQDGHIAPLSRKLSPKLAKDCRSVGVNDKTSTRKSECAISKCNFEPSVLSGSSGFESNENVHSKTPSTVKSDQVLISAKASSSARPERVNQKDDLPHDSHNKADQPRSQFTGLRQDRRMTAKESQADSMTTASVSNSTSPPPKKAHLKPVSRSVCASGTESLTSSVAVLPRLPGERCSSEFGMKGDSSNSVHRENGSLKGDSSNNVHRENGSLKLRVVAEHRAERYTTNMPESSRRASSHASNSAASEADTCRQQGDRDAVNGLQSASPSGSQLVSKIGSQNADCLWLSSWGLPSPVLEAYHGQGITTMFPWQAECLTTGNVLNGGNLVYSAPTSAGKTMVAELLILKRVLETRRKALFILPFVSVTREKTVSLQRLYQDAGVRVGGFMGSHSPVGGLQSVDVAVCTIEKGNGLVNRLMEDNRVQELGVVVIDELHMVGDSNRGYLLELLLTKICYMARKSRQSGEHSIQVIGMSATLPNLDLLASWLDADLYHSDFRPVPLTQNVKVGTTIYDNTMTKIREIELKTAFQGDEDHIIPLCLETVMGGHSVLIFCPTKAWCEKMAEKIAREFYGLMKNPTALAAYTGETGFVKASEMARLPIDQAALRNVLEQLGRSPVGLDPMLGRVLRYAVAYHHAGLTFDERDIVEGAFRQGLVKVLVATSTLSSGVNLPARRVIVRSPLFGGRLMDALSYQQMAGRAGRKGVDTEGECVLVCKEGERKMAQSLLQADLAPVTSCLQGAGDSAQLSRSMKRAILEVVVSGVASTPDDVGSYVACTLLSAALPSEDSSTAQLVTACLDFLQDNEFVTLHTVTHTEDSEVQKYQPTQLGSAVLASSMSPDEGLAVFTELQKARQCFVLANELHIIYLVTPIYSQEISGGLDWYHFYCLWDRLSPDMRLVAKTVGVEEAFLAKAITGRVPTKTAAQARAVAIHRRFYTALALHDLVQEVPLMEVAAKYNCNKGQLQSLMQSAATFAGMVTVFCGRLGWSNMELLLAQFQQRLTLGVTRELCDLVRIPLLTATMARGLFNAGYHTVASVAHAAPQEVETVFRKASPFQSNKKQDGESDWEVDQRRKARCMWLAGRKGVTELEAATAIISEAKTIIQQELGVPVQWEKPGPSASRTVLSHPSDSSSLLSKESPLAGGKNCFISGERSPALTGEQGGVVTSPESATNRLKRKSPGSVEFQTPVSSHQANRSLSCRSVLRRSSKGTSFSSRKSPLSDSSVAEPRTGHKQSRSPKDASFFGQVVVSPPASLKPPRRITPDVQTEGNGVSRKQAGVRNKLSPILRAAFQARHALTSVNQFSHHSGEVNRTSQCEGVVQKQIKSDSARSNCMDDHSPRPTSHSSHALNSDDQQQKSDQEQENLSSGAGFQKRQVRSPEAEKEVSCNGIIEQAQHDRTDSLNMPLRPAAEPLPGNQTDISPVQDPDHDGFDDSLILNTQTDNLLAGRLNECHFSGEKSPETVTASTPLGPTQSARKMSKDPKNTKQSPGEGCVSSDRLSGTDESHGNRHPVSPGVSRTRTPNAQHDQSPPATAGRSHNDHRDPSPQPVCDEESFTDDMFTSPFASLSHSGHCQQPSSSKTPTKLSDVVAKKENQNENRPEHRRSQDRDDDRRKHSQLHDEDDVMESDCGSEAEESAELIAASDYERVAYMEEGVMDSSADGSYRNSVGSVKSSSSGGPLVCADRDPEERAEQQGRPRCQGEYNIQEDLAIAAHMSDSFTSPVNDGADAKFPLVSAGPNAAAPLQPHQTSGGNVDEFSTSFTMSMMEKAFAEESFGESASETCLQKERNSQESQCMQSKNVAEAETDRRSESAVRKSPAVKCSSEKESLCAEEAVAASEGKQRNTSRGDKEPSGKLKFSSPRSSEEFVPPTPPEESSSAVSSPRVSVRRTPLRACRAREDSHHQTESGFHRETKRRKAKDKGNVHTMHNPQCVQKSKSGKGPTQATKSQSGKGTAQATKSQSGKGPSQALHMLQSAEENAPATHESQTLQKTSGKAQDLNNPSNKQAAPAGIPKTSDKAEDLRRSSSCKHTAMKVSSASHTDHNRALDDRQKETDVQTTSSNNLLPDSGADKDMAVDLDTPPPSQDSLCVIDVCANTQLFAMFTSEWGSKKEYSISLACEKKHVPPQQAGIGIGSKFVQGKASSKVREVEQCGDWDDQGVTIPGDEEDRVIVGVAVSWAGHDAYYISFAPDNAERQEADDTLAAPPGTQSLFQGERIEAVREVLRQTLKEGSSHTAVMFDSKATYTLMARGLGLVFGRCRDPQIACWLLDQGAREKTLHGMVTNFLPADLPLLEGVGGSAGYGSLGLTPQSSGSGRMRAVVESIVGRRLMDHFWGLLTDAGLSSAFTHTEMPSVLTLARMELNGFGFSEEECESQKNLMMAKLSALEQEAYTLAGHPFSLTSTDDIAQVLYLELRLPVNGDPSATRPAVRTLGPSRRAPRGGRPPKSSFSTCKDVLEKLRSFHPLPAIVLEWRRLSSAVTKHVYPLQKEKVYLERLAMHRVFSECQVHTATGRVSMMDPNLQNVPRDFDIAMPDVIGESPPAVAPGASHMSQSAHRRGGGGGSNSRLQTMRGATPQKARVSNPATATRMAVSMRHAFVPFAGGVILAADYSQLELRVIAHLSGDGKLISILNNDGDVFKLIAAQWKNTMPEAVTAEERQHAKQICYGMLYGIGPKALGEQVGVDENDAADFMESFKAKYTGMRSYLRKTVERCRESGHVTTVSGRRRYLPAIKDANPHARAQAERQAVNTTVQGSAADIVKTAMNAIDKELAGVFPDTRFPHRHCHAESERPRGAFLTLQLHDELIYEVSERDLWQVAGIVRRCMETSSPLSVRLPVKVRAGPSWGCLQDVQL